MVEAKTILLFLCIPVAVFLAGAVVGWFLRRILGRPLRPPGIGHAYFRDSGVGDGMFYAFCFLKFWSLACLAGALIGAMLYALYGILLSPGWDWSLYLSRGVLNGAFYFGLVWGPGISLVSCFVFARRLWRRNAKPDTPQSLVRK